MKQYFVPFPIILNGVGSGGGTGGFGQDASQSTQAHAGVLFYNKTYLCVSWIYPSSLTDK